MKIKYILGIMLLLAFLVGCTDPFIGDECVDDGVCTLREKYLGNCFDCFPDFEVTEDNFYAYLDGNNLHANVCVRNKVNEYKGEVKVRWNVRDSSGYQHFEEEEYVYFDSDDAWGYFSLNVDPGKINFHSFLEIGQNEQWQCFRKNFEVDPSHEYRISFHINPYEEVDEQDYFNNRVTIFVEGELDLSEYLILENIGFFRLLNYNAYTVEDVINDNYYRFKSYEAFYRTSDNKRADVMVAADFKSGDAHSLLFDVLEMLESEENYYFDETNFNNAVIYVGENNHVAMWLHGNRLIMVSSENILKNDVFLEYINQFPSEMEYVDYECEELDCNENQYPIIIGYDEFNCPIYECIEELDASFFNIAIADITPEEDMVLVSQITSELFNEGYILNEPVLFGDVNALDLNYQSTLAIYDGNVKFIIGVDSPSEQLLLVNQVASILTSLLVNIEANDYIMSNEITSPNLIDLFIQDESSDWCDPTFGIVIEEINPNICWQKNVSSMARTHSYSLNYCQNEFKQSNLEWDVPTRTEMVLLRNYICDKYNINCSTCDPYKEENCEFSNELSLADYLNNQEGFYNFRNWWYWTSTQTQEQRAWTVFLISDGVDTQILNSNSYVTCVSRKVELGCTDPEAINFNPHATEDDGSCENDEIFNCSPGQLVGDLNNDGEVNVLDLTIMINIINSDIQLGNNLCCIDLNNDGIIDEEDINIMQEIIFNQREKTYCSDI